MGSAEQHTASTMLHNIVLDSVYIIYQCTSIDNTLDSHLLDYPSALCWTMFDVLTQKWTMCKTLDISLSCVGSGVCSVLLSTISPIDSCWIRCNMLDIVQHIPYTCIGLGAMSSTSPILALALCNVLDNVQHFP